MNAYRIVSAGDAALAVEFEERIDPAVNARAIALSSALSRAIASAAMAGVRDVVPTYRSVTVYFDPLRNNNEALRALIDREAVRPVPPAVLEGESLRIPVCYGGDFGPDLATVAEFAHLPQDEVVRLHVARTYRVFMLGFLPGFAYLGMLDEQIAAPRRAIPRVRVPRGSVAIAGSQTGVYPVDSPGGWQVVGRTPVRLFDKERPALFLMQAGDTVQFYPIDRVQYERLEAGH